MTASAMYCLHCGCWWLSKQRRCSSSKVLTRTLRAQSVSLNPHGFRWHQGARACEVHSPAAGGAGLPAQQGGHAPRHQGGTSCLLCKLQQRLRTNLLPAVPAYRGHAGCRLQAHAARAVAVRLVQILNTCTRHDQHARDGILIVLFRCLQGANILVSQNNTVKLADFGAAKDKLGQVTIGEPSALHTANEPAHSNAVLI